MRKKRNNTKKKIQKIQQQNTHIQTQAHKERMTLIWTKIYNHKTK